MTKGYTLTCKSPWQIILSCKTKPESQFYSENNIPNAVKINIKLLLCHSKSLTHENSECLATLSVNTDQTLHYKPSNAIQIGLTFSSQCQTVTSDETSDTFHPIECH